jgi:mannose-6-phosphate isomerase
VWGKTHLEPWFPNSEKPIGEVWYLAESELPLLVKLLFTSERLSVQVHPDDGEDGPRGKTEMWHIVEAEPGAAIALGFRQPITRQQLWEATRTGEVERLVNWIQVKPGETYFTPAHTVHAIGAGIVLFEIQQNSDVTYRLWDYGRPREIHVEKAVPISELSVHPGATPGPVRCNHFCTELVELAAGSTRATVPEQCQIWICLEGAGEIGDQPFRQGDVWLLPDPVPLRASRASRFLHTHVP